MPTIEVDDLPFTSFDVLNRYLEITSNPVKNTWRTFTRPRRSGKTRFITELAQMLPTTTSIIYTPMWHQHQRRDKHSLLPFSIAKDILGIQASNHHLLIDECYLIPTDEIIKLTNKNWLSVTMIGTPISTSLNYQRQVVQDFTRLE